MHGQLVYLLSGFTLKFLYFNVLTHLPEPNLWRDKHFTTEICLKAIWVWVLGAEEVWEKKKNTVKWLQYLHNLPFVCYLNLFSEAQLQTANGI